MVRKKKKQRNIYRRASPIAYLVGGSVGSSVIASAMPGTSGVPLQTVGTGLSKFVSPAVAVTGAGMVLQSLKQLPKPKMKKKKYKWYKKGGRKRCREK